MKKTLVVLMAAAVISIGSAQAATTTGVTNWLNKTSAAITNTENTYNQQKAQAKAQKEAQKKAAAERKAAAKQAKQNAKNRINEEKTFWKKLFTWDWE